MGLIKAGLGAVGGVLADQWKEFFYCEAMDKEDMVTKGQKRISGRSSNTKGSDNIISNGSGIAVADGQCMIIVDQGRVVEVCAEPGEFTYDASTEPSIFAGNLGQSILDTFKAIGKRFAYGGDTGKDQRVYYFNTKELIDNKFGTPNPIPFRVVDSKIGLDIDVSVRCSGVYSYKIAKGDAIINKTYIKDCLSKKVMVNNGERPKYYVENNHPAIIDAVTFGRVQEELARRSGKPKTKQVGTKTEQGKYSSKYAMTELLVCGECKTPYRRCTWTVKGQKKIVWRCINRLDFGKKYCHNSPTVEESILQRAVMRAIMETAQQNLGVLQTLKVHIGMGLQSEQTEDNSMDLQIRIAEIDAEFKAMLAKISTDTVDAFDEEKAKRLMDEKARLQQQLGNIRDGQLKREQTQSRLDDIYTILDGLKNRPMEYDEQIVRQLLECITVDSKEQITVIFVGGLKVVQPLID